MNIERYLKGKKKVIDRELGKYLPSANVKPGIIHKAMRYAVFSGGKRIRPVFCIAAFEACGGKGKSILPVACGIELIHAYTLIHDDLPCMDDDNMRRGKPTCHKKFGEDVALLAGDALLTLGFGLLSLSGNSEIVGEVSEAVGSRGTIGGQIVDILAASDKRQRISKKKIDYIVYNKTGKLFEAALVAGGMLKDVGRKKINSLRGFGRCIGFTFQLVDDLIDDDGYVTFYGEDYARGKADSFTEKGKKLLDVFGKKKQNLSGMADLILKRKY